MFFTTGDEFKNVNTYLKGLYIENFAVSLHNAKKETYETCYIFIFDNYIIVFFL